MTDTGFVEEIDISKKIEFALWKKVYQFARPYRKKLLLLIAAGIAVALSDVTITVVTKYLIDDALEHGWQSIWPYVMAYGVLALIICGCIYLFINLAGQITTGVSHDIRQAAFEKLQSLPYGYYDRRPVGWLVSRLTSDCDKLSRIIAWGTLDLTWSPVMMIAIASIMFYYNWLLALVVLSVVPVLLGISYVFQRKILRASRKVRKENSHLTSAYNEEIDGVRTTKSLVQEERNLSEFGGRTDLMYGASMENAIYSALYLPVVITLGSIATALALWAGGWSASVAGGTGLTVGTLILFLAYTRQFFDPINEIAMTLTMALGSQAAAERVVELLETEPAIDDNPRVRDAMRARSRSLADGQTTEADGLAIDGMPNAIDKIEFRDVTFQYVNGPTVLKNFNLTVRAGESIALVGPTGSGKTTIASLACRFYEPTGGQILIDGIDYRERSLLWLQSQLGIVLQTPHLFSGTIRENIRYGRLDAVDEEVEEAAHLVGANTFIERLPEGYEAIIGENGVNLSTGQRQLISFARAIIARPQIMVLDEATSSIDAETETLIQRGIDAMLKGRISFVIAHRLSTIRNADRILVIEAGEIIEEGNHHSLLQAGGHYHRLYTNQFVVEHEMEALRR